VGGRLDGYPETIRTITEGIEAGEFELHYQPQIDIQKADRYGVEALVRWRKGGQLLAPGDFLPAAEACSAIAPLTDHILTLALTQAGIWHSAGRTMRVAINLSGANLKDFTVASRLEALTSEHGVDPGKVTLEVTETAVLEEPETARAVLEAIAGLGFSISVDDFGTGYSSLHRLRLFPVDEIKIDRSFVSTIAVDGDAFTSGAIRLGHDLGLRVVAEGVEDAATLEILQSLDCDAAQGYLFAKPLPVAELEAWLDESLDAVCPPSRLDLAVTPDGEGLDLARRSVEEMGSQLGFDEEAIWDMKLAATEALANAIDACEWDSEGLIQMRLLRRGGTLMLEVRGKSERPGGPRAYDPHRGRGIAIMTAFTDGFELKHGEDATLVRLSKNGRATGDVRV
jgi:EAL domain-containing protein (putative c-di-GMP-specific phosphodiesterase class I)/anti-sigma regulatory factor (Ser/Thr protein kinase)